MKQRFAVDEVYQLYPEYFVLKVNDFNRWSKVPLDQWLYFLSTSEIPDDASAPGLVEAREKLRLIQMSREEQLAYDRYMMDRAILRNTMTTAEEEGHFKGLVEGRAEGHKAAKYEDALKMKKLGSTVDFIAQVTGLTVEEIKEL